MSSTPNYQIVGAGNPLLDCSLEYDDASVFERYDIKPASACLAEPKHAALFEEICSNSQVQYIPGGATLNSIRVSQWVLGQNGKTGYIGSVGKDETADTFENGCKNDKLDVALHKSEECQTTGRCAVVISGKERSLVADLQAANHYPVGSLDTEEAQALWKNSGIVYSAGFWLTVCPEGMQKMAAYCKENDRKYCLNISAPFLAEFFIEPMKKVLENTDILFGNEDECEALAKALSVKSEDNVERAKAFSKHCRKEGNYRTVVITQGLDPVIIANGDNVNQYSVPPVEKEKIVDTNGAGDAFVGGFLAALAKGESEAMCVAYGNAAAGQVIQVSGVSLEGLTPTIPETAATEHVAAEN